MHVLFLAPHFPANQPRFVYALKAAGAMVTGIGDCAASSLPDGIRNALDGYEQVRSLGDVDAVTEAVQRVQRRGPWVDRLEATVEAHMLIAAVARQRTGIPGLSANTVNLCRDKFEMKRALTRQGIPCARHAAVDDADGARAALRHVGLPAILKPRDGAGAAHTYRLDSAEDLERAIKETGLDQRPSAFTMESFISGHEGFVDTLTVNGEVVFEGICHYYPNVLEAMRTRWISPQIVITNRLDAPGYTQLRAFARKVIGGLGITTSATHMEWFYGDGGLVFSEIGARPPGCCLWDLYCEANDFDLYRAWADAIVHRRSAPKPSRRFAAGLISIRPDADGVIKGYTGLDRVASKYGDNIFRSHIQPVGSHTAPVGSGYLGHSWFWVKHPDYDVCRAILDDIGRTVHCHAG